MVREKNQDKNEMTVKKDKKSSYQNKALRSDYDEIYFELKSIAWKLYDLTCDFKQLQVGAETFDLDDVFSGKEDETFRKIFYERYEESHNLINSGNSSSDSHRSKHSGNSPVREVHYDSPDDSETYSLPNEIHDPPEEEFNYHELKAQEYDTGMFDVEEDEILKNLSKIRNKKDKRRYVDMTNRELEEEIRKRKHVKTRNEALQLPNKPPKTAYYKYKNHSCQEVRDLYDKLQKELESKVKLCKLYPRKKDISGDENVYVIDTKSFMIVALPKERLGIAEGI